MPGFINSAEKHWSSNDGETVFSRMLADLIEYISTKEEIARCYALCEGIAPSRREEPVMPTA